MFLWVCLQINSICDATTDEAIHDALKDLPRDLPETYRRILCRYADSEVSLQKRIFTFIVVALRPLNVLGRMHRVLQRLLQCDNILIARMLIEKTLAAGYLAHFVNFYIEEPLLLTAIATSSASMVQMLLDYGATADFNDASLQSALNHAVLHNKVETIEVLRRNVAAKDYRGLD